MIQLKLPAKRSERLKFIVFSVIGVFNTVFDIAIYIVILNLSHQIIIANLVATSAALVGSYFLNSRITFQSKKWTKFSFIAFVAVTVFGLWVLQTGCIYGLNHLAKSLPSSFWQHFGHFRKLAMELLPKLIATAVTFVWNYIWYNKVIFRKKSEREEATRLAYTDL